ncbi:toll-like receptor 4 [Mercenaria mercenaria]|uniref:toll-like receptor 4 n=1 Tax=Mercenaria mercenaria TaxID=6596 RepID=UPI00234F6772|nr:toll-like receptor 4 [Mercenaria mercenaria]
MIDGLYDKQLPNISRLSKLYFSGQYGRCRIPYLTSLIFENNTQIQSLYLSNCSIITIQPGMFKVLPDIQDLDLSWNTKLGFTNITNGLKCNNTLKRLKRLNMNSVYDYYKFNGCSALGKENIAYFNDTDLEVYSIAGNNIVHVEDDAIPYFPKTLKYLSVQDNMLMYGKYVDEIFERGTFRNLVYFDTSKMFISHTPNNFIHNNTNRILKLLTEYPQTEDTDVNLEMFTRFQVKDYFTILDDRLRKLNITPYGNNSLNISERKNNIEYLDLSENMPGIVQVSLKLFEHSPVIKFLNVSNNFLGYQLLNGISLFYKYKSLRVLDLSRNSITHLLDGIFENQIHLEQLYLSFNKIASMTFLKALKNLHYLDLSYNQIISIPSDVRSSMNNLMYFTIKLPSNPLNCTCYNLDFLQWVKKFRVKFQNMQETKCKNEYRLNLTLDKVNYDQLHSECLPPTYYILISVVSLCIFAFLIIVSCGLIYRFKCHWNLRYLFYMTKFKLTGGYQPIDDREYDKDVFVSYANEDRGFVLIYSMYKF